MTDFNWGNLLSSGLMAYGNYAAGNQYGNAGNAAASMADPFGPYRSGYAQKLGGLTGQPQNFFNGNWNQQLNGFSAQGQPDLYGGQWNQKLNSLQSNPSSITQNPGYQFGLSQGVNAIEGSRASKGLLNSGATGKALTRYGQDYAGQQFNNERNFLAGQANNETGLAANQFNQNRNFLGNQAQFESTLGANQYNQDRNFLGQAAGANFNPSVAAALAMQGRTGQLAANNQGLGNLLGSQSGAGGIGGAGTLGNSQVSSIINSMLKNYMTGSSGGVGAQGYPLPGTQGGSGITYGGDMGADTPTNWGSQPTYGNYGDSGGVTYGGDMGADTPTDWSSFGTGSNGATTGGYEALGGYGGSGLTAEEMATLEAQAGYGTAGAGELALTGEGTAAGTGAAGTTAAGGTAAGGAAAGTVGAGTAFGILGALAMWANADMEKDSANSFTGGNRTLQRLIDAGVPLSGLIKSSYTPQTASDITPGVVDKWLTNYTSDINNAGINPSSPTDWATQNSLGNPNQFNSNAFNSYIQSIPGASAQLPGDITSDWLGDVMKNWSGLGLNQFGGPGTGSDPQYEAAVNAAIMNDPRFIAAYNNRMSPQTSIYDDYQP